MGDIEEYIILLVAFISILKLARADYLAEKAAEGSLFLFAMSIFVMTYSGIPFGLSMLAFEKLSILHGSRMFISAAIGILVGGTILYVFHRDLIHEALKPNAQTNASMTKQSHEETLEAISESVMKEVENKGLFQFGFLVYLVIIYNVLNELEFFEEFYYFMDYTVHWALKYTMLILGCILSMVAYSNYYDKFCEGVFVRFSDLIRFLASEGKCVLLRDSNGYPNVRYCVVARESLRRASDKARFYTFVLDKDGRICYQCAPQNRRQRETFPDAYKSSRSYTEW